MPKKRIVQHWAVLVGWQVERLQLSRPATTTRATTAHHRVHPAEALMVRYLLLCLALTLEQTEPPSGDGPPAPAPPAIPDRWMLMQSCQGTYPGWLLDGHKLQVYGWSEMSFTGSTNCFDQLPMGFNYRANEFLLQQNWLRVERTVDQAAMTPALGFRFDTILPGSDYRFTIARGLFDGQLTANDGGPNSYGIDPVQFYTEAYIPHIGRGLDVKLGRFFALYGVESIDTTQNALASRSYTFIYNPFTHTGLLTTLKLTDAWSVQNGLVTGSDVFVDPAATPTYIGSVQWAPPTGRDRVLSSVILGPGRFNQAESFNNPQVFDLVYTHTFSDHLTYSLDALFGYQTDVPDVGTATWFGFVNYLTYKFTPRLSGTTRQEFFRDVQGQRTGFDGLYTVLTAGVTLGPWPSVILRPELRYDNNNDARPFDGKHGLFTATADVILRW